MVEKSEIEHLISDIEDANIDHLNWEEFDEKITTADAVLGMGLKKLKSDIQKPIDQENDLDRELQRNARSVKDPQLAEKHANDIKNIRLEKIHILEDMKEGHTLQVKLNKAARLKYAKALLNAKGATLKKELFEEEAKLFDRMWARFENMHLQDSLLQKENDRSKTEAFQFSLGQIVAKLGNIDSLKAELDRLHKDKNDLSDKLYEREQKITELQSKITDILSDTSKKVKDIDKSDAPDADKDRKKAALEAEAHAKVTEARMEASRLQTDNAIDSTKHEFDAGMVTEIDKMLPKKDVAKHDESFLRNKLGDKNFEIVRDYFIFGKDSKKVMAKHNLSDGRSISSRIASASRFGVISEIEELAKGQKKEEKPKASVEQAEEAEKGEE